MRDMGWYLIYLYRFPERRNYSLPPLSGIIILLLPNLRDPGRAITMQDFWIVSFT